MKKFPRFLQKKFQSRLKIPRSWEKFTRLTTLGRMHQCRAESKITEMKIFRFAYETEMCAAEFLNSSSEPGSEILTPAPGVTTDLKK